jgi:predicted ABC-type ATPase
MPARRMFIVAGPPGAGKSSLSSLSDFADHVFNADDRAAELNAGSHESIPNLFARMSTASLKTSFT